MQKFIFILLVFLGPTASGQSFEWAFQTGYGIGQNITTDQWGNVIVVGNANASFDFDPGPDSAYNVHNANGDLFIAKYNSDGKYIWHVSVGSVGTDIVRDVAVDSLGDIYITGRNGGTMDIDPDTPVVWLQQVNRPDAFIAKFDSSGDYKWAFLIAGTRDEMGMGLDVDAKGNLYATGYYFSTVDFDPGPGQELRTPPGGTRSPMDSYLAKYDPQGNLVWVQTVSGIGNNFSKSVYCDKQGLVYITGRFTDSLQIDTSSSVYLKAAGTSDGFIAAYDTSGNFVWSRHLSNTKWSLGEEIVGHANHIYATGVYQDSINFVEPNGNNYLLASNQGREHYLIKLDRQGKVQWKGSFKGNNHFEGGGGIIANHQGVFSTGQYYEKTDFDLGPDSLFLNVLTPNDLYLAGYDHNGKLLWANPIYTQGIFDLSSGIAISDSSIYITGVYGQRANFDSASVSSVLTHPGTPIFVAKYQNTCKDKVRDTTSLICEGDSILINGKFRTQEGLYSDTSLSVSGCRLISNYNLLVKSRARCSHKPYVLKEDLKISKVMDVAGNQPVRLVKNPISSKLVYATFRGEIYQIDSAGLGLASTLIFDSLDHGINYLQGALYIDSSLYLLGNYKASGQSGMGLMMRGKLQSNSQTKWDTVFSTQPYPSSAVLFDHAFSDIVLNPTGDSLYVSSGSRTDHGEVEDIGGLYPNTRETALNSTIFRIPLNTKNLLLQNDSTWLDASGYVYCKGLRNTFDMDFDIFGNLIGVENSGDRDDPEEVNLLAMGKHYGFPWMMGDHLTPQQFPGYDPDADSLLNKNFLGYKNGKFYNDSLFPQRPLNLRLELPLPNIGPDGAFERDSASGALINSGAIGDTLYSLSAHRSPVSILFDRARDLGMNYSGKSFVLSFNSGYDGLWLGESAINPLLMDSSEDLTMLSFRYNGGGRPASFNTDRIAAGFIKPVSALLSDTSIYVLEYGDKYGRGLWRIDFPRCELLNLHVTSNLLDSCSTVVAFVDSSIGVPTEYLWEFGDGSSSALANPIHSYQSPGVYQVRVSIENCFGIVRDTFEVETHTQFSSFTAQSRFKIGDTVFFESNSPTAIAYHWEFGNGDTSLNSSPYMIYQQPGTYTVSLKVTDSLGCEKDTSMQIKIWGGASLLNSFADQLKVFPNPSRDNVSIQYDGSQQLLVKLLSMDGKIVLNESFSKRIRLDLEHLAKGAYLLKIQSEDGSVFLRHHEVLIIQ